MLKNYLSIALRNLSKHKFYAFINVVGLSIGLSCFLFIALFVMHEKSFDQHFADAKNIYRIDFFGNIEGNSLKTALMSAPAAKDLVEEFPEIVESTRFRSSGNWFIQRKDLSDGFKEEEASFIDPNFFEFWDVDLIYGDRKTCLDRPHTLVMSRSLAEKIFGDQNPVGEVVKLDNKTNYEVAGVYEDFPENTHFQFNLLLTMLDRVGADDSEWLSFNFNTYIKFREDADVEAFQTGLPDYLQLKVGPEIEKYFNASYDDFMSMGNSMTLSLVPLAEIHLYSHKLGELHNNGDAKYLYIFSAVGLFILLLACINFMNLATARSAGRAKEVGVRKVLGARRTQLVSQFLSEAVLLSIFATLVSFLLCKFMLPYFNLLSGKELTDEQLFHPIFITMMLVIAVMVGLLAGSYPAFYLSKFRPIDTLKGKLNLGMKSGALRSTLVVFQFVVSIAMIICTSVVYDQLMYIQNKKLGYNRDQILIIEDVWLLREKTRVFLEEGKKSPFIKNASLTDYVPIGPVGNNNVYWRGIEKSGKAMHILSNRMIDENYVNVLEMNLVEGRTFSREIAGDSMAILVNETTLKRMELEGLGSKISTFSNFGDTTGIATFHVVGILEDFHYNSMRERIDPIMFRYQKDKGNRALFKIQGNQTREVLEHLKTLWNDMAPGQPFTYQFLDDQFDDFYETEQRLGQIFIAFAVIAIFIACLGLFGLAAFTAEQRIKEIGIRKVMGATVMQIVNMLSMNFLKLVAIAFIIAAPVAYYSMYRWLEDFAYRTPIKWWIFLVAGLLSVAVAWLTMSVQSYMAATVNPARSLKDE